MHVPSHLRPDGAYYNKPSLCCNKKKILTIQNTCLLKHEIALYTESTEAVCGKSDCLNTPFVSQSFHYILGNCNHKYTFYYLVFPYLSFIMCIFMS